jgi:hypothetical protein
VEERMILSLILYDFLLLFAIKMILKLAPPAPARRRSAIQPINLRPEFTRTRMPSLEIAPFDLDVELDTEAQQQLVKV